MKSKHKCYTLKALKALKVCDINLISEFIIISPNKVNNSNYRKSNYCVLSFDEDFKTLDNIIYLEVFDCSDFYL